MCVCVCVYINGKTMKLCITSAVYKCLVQAVGHASVQCQRQCIRTEYEPHLRIKFRNSSHKRHTHCWQYRVAGHIASQSCHSNVRLWRHCGNWDSAAPSGCGRVSLSGGPPLVVGAAAPSAVPGDALLFCLPTRYCQTPTHPVELNADAPRGSTWYLAKRWIASVCGDTRRSCSW